MKLVTIFPKLGEVQLNKDVGKVPEELSRSFGFQAELWGIAKIEADKRADIDLISIPDRALAGSIHLRMLWRLARMASEISVLMLFHFKLETLLFCLCYKIFNPQGVIYIKSDLNSGISQLLRGFSSRQAIRIIVHLATCISFERRDTRALFSDYFPHQVSKFLNVPNGCSSHLSDAFVDCTTKQNAIIMVGRLNDPNKGVMSVLRALSKIRIDISKWQLWLVGPSDEIAAEISEFVQAYPALQEMVKLIGPVFDPEQLSSYYCKAKIYVLASRTEGFPLVLPEAAYRGCAIVGYDVGGVVEITDGGKYGIVCPPGDEEALSRAIALLIKDSTRLEDINRDIQHFARQSFTWGGVVEPLGKRLKEELALREVK